MSSIQQLLNTIQSYLAWLEALPTQLTFMLIRAAFIEFSIFLTAFKGYFSSSEAPNLYYSRVEDYIKQINLAAMFSDTPVDGVLLEVIPRHPDIFYNGSQLYQRPFNAPYKKPPLNLIRGNVTALVNNTFTRMSSPPLLRATVADTARGIIPYSYAVAYRKSGLSYYDGASFAPFNTNLFVGMTAIKGNVWEGLDLDGAWRTPYYIRYADEDYHDGMAYPYETFDLKWSDETNSVQIKHPDGTWKVCTLPLLNPDGTLQ